MKQSILWSAVLGSCENVPEPTCFPYSGYTLPVGASGRLRLSLPLSSKRIKIPESYLPIASGPERSSQTKVWAWGRLRKGNNIDHSARGMNGKGTLLSSLVSIIRRVQDICMREFMHWMAWTFLKLFKVTGQNHEINSLMFSMIRLTSFGATVFRGHNCLRQQQKNESHVPRLASDWLHREHG